MNDISPKERLSRALNQQTLDRSPVICPGGMMNAAIVDVMNKTGHVLPDAHSETVLMTELAEDVSEHTGFENFGIPFCMTVEAEVLGSDINFGTLSCEPKIEKENYPSTSLVEYKDIQKALRSGRVITVAEASSAVARRHGDVPLIGNLTGPVSTAASLVDPMTFLKELRKDKSNSHRVIDYVSDFLIAYARLLIESGASAISIADPTATGEILGPKMFEEYALHYLNKVVDGIHQAGIPVIVHICGDINPVKNQVAQIRANAISTDAMVNLKKLKEEFPNITTMGNLSTYLLEFGDPEKVIGATEKLIGSNIDIISPACGLSTSSSLANIRAMTDTVKGN